MATSSLALKRCFSSGILFTARPVILPAVSRSFSTKAHDPFYDVFDETIVSHPTRQVPQGSQEVVLQHNSQDYDISLDMKMKTTTDAVYFRMFMPGVRKENVKVWVENGQLVAQGKRDKDFVDGENDYALSIGYNLPMHLVKANEITSEMKNGSLKVRVPLSVIVVED